MKSVQDSTGGIVDDRTTPTWLDLLLNRKPNSSAIDNSTIIGMDLHGSEKNDYLEDDSAGDIDGLLAAVDPASRYRTEFNEMALVGFGGGGEVWKVVNRLDRRNYAVKKIDLDPTDSALNRKITREVTTISSLSHNHVVRYYAAWVEEGVSNSSEMDNEDKSSSISNGISNSENSDSNFDHISAVSENGFISQSTNIATSIATLFDIPPDKHPTDNSSSGIIFDRNSSYGDSSSSSSNTKDSNCLNETISTVHAAVCNENGRKKSIIDTDMDAKAIVSVIKRLLYIQMEYCYATLQEAISGGNLWRSENEVGRLFLQLLDAIQYIHSKRVIHRDLKVSYIFVLLNLSYI